MRIGASFFLSLCLFWAEWANERHLNCVKMSKSLTLISYSLSIAPISESYHIIRWCLPFTQNWWMCVLRICFKKHHFDLCNNCSEDNTWWCKAATFDYSSVFFFFSVVVVPFTTIIFDAVTINSLSLSHANFAVVRAIAIFARLITIFMICLLFFIPALSLPHSLSHPFEISCSLWVSCECVLIHRRREKSRQLYIAIYFVQNTSKECLLIEFRLARIIHAISHFSRWNCGYEHHQCFIFFVALSFWGFCFLI